MKHKLLLYFLLIVGGGLLTTSCKKYLDINQNPNSPVTSTPQLLLPTAITATASLLNSYNTYGAQNGMYMANAGGYGGFGSIWTYNYSVTDFASLWNLYDVNEDFYLAKTYSEEDPTLIYFNSIAKIMMAHNFQLLVDTYNSIPYSEALMGNQNTTPNFEDPAEIYADLATQLDAAIASITEGQNSTVQPVRVTAGQDPLFGGDMNMWKKFANTVKLRLMVTGNGKVSFSNTSFNPVGFLTEDALINPGYVRDNGKQNPKWNSWAYTYTGTDGAKSYMPSTFIMGFYNGKKLTDMGRGAAVFYKFPSTPTNRLGIQGVAEASPGGSFWYASDNRAGSSSGNAPGPLKGPNAGMPVITAAESYFLQAEAVLKGIIPSGDAEDLFYEGMNASFYYLYSLPDGSINTAVTGDPDDDMQDYLDENSSKYIVNFSLAADNAQKLEAIITQKFIALNMVNSNQAWNDYRRTHYPTVISTAGADGYDTFASTQSQSGRTDKLPTRILYPSSESSNNANAPREISPLTSLIFWAMP